MFDQLFADLPLSIFRLTLPLDVASIKSSATEAKVVCCLRNSVRLNRSSSALGSIPFCISSRQSLALSRAF